MKVMSEFGASSDLAIRKCILIYESAGQANVNSNPVATIHRVHYRNNSPVILPGEAPTVDAMRKLIFSLSGSGHAIQFLPETLIGYSPSQLIWWCPSKVRQIFFKCKEGERENALSGKSVTHPSLLFSFRRKGRDFSLCVFALSDNIRPTLNTDLYQAPYLNVDVEGIVCLGNTTRPEVLTPESIPAIESNFFDTKFTHTNVDGPRLVGHPEGHSGFWRSLLGKRIKQVPSKYLFDIRRKVNGLFI